MVLKYLVFYFGLLFVVWFVVLVFFNGYFY